MVFFIPKNILQHQQFVESLAELLEPIWIPSSVMTFAVLRSLVLMRLPNFFLEKVKTYLETKIA